MAHTKDHRETQAEAEVGVTTISPRLARCWVGFFLVVLSGPLLWSGFEGLRGGEEGPYVPLSAAFAIVPALGEVEAAIADYGIWRGLVHVNTAMRRRMVAFEENLEINGPLRDPVVRSLNRWLGGSLGASNGDVYPGRNDWLFYGPALRHVTGPGFLSAQDAGTPSAVEALVAFQSDLAKRNIALVILPVPSKASIYPEAIVAGAESHGPRLNPSHEAFVQRMEALGIAIVDPSSLLVAGKSDFETYLSQDSHWSPKGMDVVAQAVARRIEAHGNLSDGGTRPYRRGEGEVVHQVGDLAAMLLREETHGVAIMPVVDETGQGWIPQRASEVLVLGDSFTNIYSQPDLGWGTGAGFAEQLSYHLQRPVDRIAQNDQGAFASRKALSEALASGDDRLANTRVVVFEFAARELSWGDWRTDLPLELGTPRVSDAPSGPQTVSGQVLEVSQPPTPGSVPYKDCIISIALETDEGGRRLVYAWGMRDHQWTEVTQWRVGQTVSLEVVPWAAVSDDVGSINRMPLEADTGVTHTPWWFNGGTGAVALPSKPTKGPVAPDVAPGYLADQVRRWDLSGQQVLMGEEGWLFFVPELRSLSVGPFWGEDAPRVSRARNRLHADPLPAILDFHRQLKGAGIALILMPVPPKSAIYGDKLKDGDLEAAVALATGATSPLGIFINQLRDEGVSVVDLREIFVHARDDATHPLYCRTDSHWAPEACALAAKALGEIIQPQPWYVGRPKTAYAERSLEVPINGDLAAMAEEDIESEIRTVRQFGTLDGDEFQPLASDRSSPVLLIGDSHNLVFHAGGDMHAVGGGLPEHLAHTLGFPVDVVAVRGSGATTPRISLARRQDNLVGKNVVIWCFSSREFTESVTGWRVVSVLP